MLDPTVQMMVWRRVEAVAGKMDWKGIEHLGLLVKGSMVSSSHCGRSWIGGEVAGHFDSLLV